MKNLKKSKQRDSILKLIQESQGHFSADWIYQTLKQEFSNLSIGTVYRNLNILVEQQLIKRIDFGSNFDRYEANTTEHYHFICNECGAIIDIPMPIEQSLNEKARELGDFSIDYHQIEFFGLCSKCRA